MNSGEVAGSGPRLQRERLCMKVATMLTFWNLQPDDEHDFMLTAPDSTG